MKAISLFIYGIMLGCPLLAGAQPRVVLSLEDAKSRARTSSQEILAAREALSAAKGRALQVGALSNPTLSLSAEQTDAGSAFNRQGIVGLDQRIDFGRQRSARIQAARFRSQAAEARVLHAIAQVDFEVTSAYARAVGADRRSSLARQSAAAFTEAVRISEQRVAAGDISLYTHRRLKLEGARYAALEAQANLDRRTARIVLSGITNASLDSVSSMSTILSDSLPPALPSTSVASLQQRAFQRREDLSALSYELQALAADATAARAERIPVPVVFGGYKTEQSTGSPRLSGFAASVSIPLSLWDRREGSIQAAAAESRRAAAEQEGARRRIAREVAQTYEALLEAERERALLAPQLGAESAAALRSAQTAYNEGDITLLEWLDAVRAYNEAETAYATLLAEVKIRRAALDRLVGGDANIPNSEIR